MHMVFRWTVSAFLVFWMSASLSESRPPSPASPVVVDVAQVRELAPVAWYSGTVLSTRDARLAAEVEGRLSWVAEVGTQVEQGETVARIDDTFLQKQARVENATIKSEQARLLFLDKEVKRLRKLVKQQNVSDSQLDQQISNQSVARASLESARARFQEINERIKRAQLVAPFPGVISQRFLQGGEWADNGAAIVRLVDSQTLEIKTQIPRNALAQVSSDQVLNLKHGEQSFTAKVRAIVPIGSDDSRLHELRLVPTNAPPSGTLVRVAIPIAASREVVSIHRDALVLRRNSIAVFKIGPEQIAERVAIEVGVASGDYIEVIGSVQAGDQIVTRGGERLQPGQKVTILNTASST